MLLRIKIKNICDFGKISNIRSRIKKGDQKGLDILLGVDQVRKIQVDYLDPQ